MDCKSGRSSRAAGNVCRSSQAPGHCAKKQISPAHLLMVHICAHIHMHIHAAHHPPTHKHTQHTHTPTAHTQIARSAHKHKPTRTCTFVQVKSQVLCARRKIGQAGPVTCRIRSGRAGQQAFQNKPGRSSRAVLHSGPVKPGGFWWDPGQAARPGPMPSLGSTYTFGHGLPFIQQADTTRHVFLRPSRQA